MWEACRYCGRSRTKGEPPWSDLTCPRCAGSPLCANCGHRREDHSRVFVDRAAPGCKAKIRDVQSLSVEPCGCPGFEPIDGSFADAPFANTLDEQLPPLRVVPRV